jgi:hypothetical protein
LKTKVMDRGNSKKFNVFKYSDNNTIWNYYLVVR